MLIVFNRAGVIQNCLDQSSELKAQSFSKTLLKIFKTSRIVGVNWKNRSNRSMVRFKVPFLSMLNFSVIGIREIYRS